MTQIAKLSVGSLFSGIGGFDLGFERTGGFKTEWFCEIDEFCQRVLAKHWPSTPIYEDITTLESPPKVDVLCGGFPCTDISVAGKGAGITGPESGLWRDFARLIGEIQPKWVVVENVPALRSRGLSKVLADLHESGYDAEWEGIPASAVGAPHQRDRIWIVAYPRSQSVRPQSGPPRRENSSLSGDNGSTEFMAYANGEGPQGHGGPDEGGGEFTPAKGSVLRNPDSERRNGRSRNFSQPNGWGEFTYSDWWESEPNVGRVAVGIPDRVDRLRSLGNSLVPQIAEWIGYRILEAEYGEAQKDQDQEIQSGQTPQDGKDQEGPKNTRQQAAQHEEV